MAGPSVFKIAFSALLLLSNLALSNGAYISHSSRQPKTPNFPVINFRKAFQRTMCVNREGEFTSFEYNDGDAFTTVKDPPVKPDGQVATCDHLLELNIVLKVMESPGGPCNQLAPEYRSAKGKQAADLVTTTKVKPIVEIVVKNYNNLVFAENLLEDQKTLVVEYAFDNRTSLLPDENSSADPLSTPQRLKAVNDYLSKTKSRSQGVAADLDAKIAELFPGTTLKAVYLWNQVLATAESVANTPPPQLIACPDSPPASPTTD
ncbi:hypothetical protein C8J57DRAFT_1492146 [Mycena rebaudengoi]|nr:hypothetical protein C8J57DRAFT_1492146 [Mycena rebaudengoi]